MTEQKHKEKMLEEQEIHFIELPKFLKSKKNLERKLDQWLVFIENSDKELIEVAKKKNDIIKEAEAEYEYLTGDEAMQRIAFLKRKYELDQNSMIADAKEEGMEEGLVEGRAEGKQEEKLETAKKMLELGAEIEFIEKATGLKKEEILKLREDEE